MRFLAASFLLLGCSVAGAEASGRSSSLLPAVAFAAPNHASAGSPHVGRAPSLGPAPGTVHHDEATQTSTVGIAPSLRPYSTHFGQGSLGITPRNMNLPF